MSRFFSPNQQFVNAAGVPFGNGTVSFFASGTNTPQSTFSNQALSIANRNPLPLDSAGRAGAVFLANVAYKVVVADSLGNTQISQDPVYASDFSTPAQFLIFAGNPNGNVAGNQGGGLIPASAVYDSTDNLLFICASTGPAASAVWVSINVSTSGSIPTGAIIPFGGGAVPSSFLLCSGASVSTTTYASLFGVIGTIYGGSGGNFNVPDLRGRAPAGLDNMGGSAAGRISVAGGTFDGTIFAAAGGTQNWTLAQAHLPALPPLGGFTGSSVTGTGTINGSNYAQGGVAGDGSNGGSPQTFYQNGAFLNPTIGPGTLTPVGTVGNMGTGASYPIMPPALIVNYLIKT